MIFTIASTCYVADQRSLVRYRTAGLGLYLPEQTQTRKRQLRLGQMGHRTKVSTKVNRKGIPLVAIVEDGFFDMCGRQNPRRSKGIKLWTAQNSFPDPHLGFAAGVLSSLSGPLLFCSALPKGEGGDAAERAWRSIYSCVRVTLNSATRRQFL